MIARVRVLTPNLPEAAALLAAAPARDEDEMRTQAQRLLALGPAAVLIKGGHVEGGNGGSAGKRRPSGGPAAKTLRLTAPRIATETPTAPAVPSPPPSPPASTRAASNRRRARPKSYVSAAIAAADQPLG